MYILFVIIAVLVGVVHGHAAAKTNMVVLDKATTTAKRVELGLNITDYNVTTFIVPTLEDFNDVDYDFLDDRLYVLKSWRIIKSVFVNGTDERHVTELASDAYTVAIDPYEKIVFAGRIDIGDNPARVVSLSANGTNMQVLARRRRGAQHMGVDYQNKYLYWKEYAGCSCLYRIRYNGGVVETVRDDVFLKTCPHGIDFTNNFLYGNSYRGLIKFPLETGYDDQEVISTKVSGHAHTETVYDPRTERLFLVSTVASSYVYVYTTNGTHVGDLEWLQLTKTENKIVRVNPL